MMGAMLAGGLDSEARRWQASGYRSTNRPGTKVRAAVTAGMPFVCAPTFHCLAVPGWPGRSQ